MLGPRASRQPRQAGGGRPRSPALAAPTPPSPPALPPRGRFQGRPGAVRERDSWREAAADGRRPYEGPAAGRRCHSPHQSRASVCGQTPTITNLSSATVGRDGGILRHCPQPTPLSLVFRRRQKQQVPHSWPASCRDESSFMGGRKMKRGAGRSRTDDGGFAIRCLSHLATAPCDRPAYATGTWAEWSSSVHRENRAGCAAMHGSHEAAFASASRGRFLQSRLLFP